MTGVKRLLFFMIAMVSIAIAQPQTVFTVEEISEEEYLNAESRRKNYNYYIQDSISDQQIVEAIITAAQERLQNFDQQTIKEIEYDLKEPLIISLPTLNLYGLIIEITPYSDNVWWFDMESYTFAGETPYPTAINANGIFASQIDYDCDWKIDLQFFKRTGIYVYKFQAYYNIGYNSDWFNPCNTIFWGGDNILYLKTFNYTRDCITYLKIVLQ